MNVGWGSMTQDNKIWFFLGGWVGDSKGMNNIYN